MAADWSDHEARCRYPPHPGLLPTGATVIAPAPYYDVIIVGAGVAGLTTARELISAGEDSSSILVLEARQRTGGRINTRVVSETTLVDLGANFIHGIKDNPIYQIMQAHQMKTQSFNWEQGDFLGGSSHEVAAADRTPSRGPGIVKRLHAFADNKKHDISEYLEEAREAWLAEVGQEATTDISLQELIDQYLLPRFAPDEVAAFGLRYQLHLLLDADYAADQRDMSARYWDQDDLLAGGDHILPGSYAPFVEILSRDAPLVFGQQVTSVAHAAAADRWELTTSTGHQYSCRHLVMTAPLGVLKAGSITFTPALPADFVAALDLLGTANLIWVDLVFADPWWPFGQDCAVWNVSKDSAFHWPYFLHRHTARPFVIQFSTGGPSGDRVDALSDEALLTELLALLTELAGQPPPQPLDLIRSRWRHDPLAYGTYTYCRVGFTEKHQQRLQQPIQKSMFFAGEHMNGPFRGTVHGAHLSGIRAAKQVQAARRQGRLPQ
jgi:monoamine oxidase